MYTRQHIIASFLLAGILFPFIGLQNSLLIFFSGFLFDVDHYLYYIFKFRRYSIFDCYRESIKISKGLLPRPKKPFIHLFHTIEFYLLLGIFSIYFPFLGFVLIGLVLHIILDVIDGVRKKTLFFRVFSLLHFFLKKKTY